MYKFTQGSWPLVMGLTKMTIFLKDYYYSEFNSYSCGKVLYTKKDQFSTKIAYVQDKKKLPQAQKIYTGRCGCLKQL